MRGRLCLLAAASISLGLAQTPVISGGGVINAAAVAGGDPVAPGSLISIFGSALASSTASADSIPLSTSLADVQSVTVNGKAVPLVFVSSGQINAQVPWEVQPGSANVVVNRASGSSQPASVQVAAAAPAIFFFTSGGGQLFAIAQNADDFTLAWPEGAVSGATTHPISRGATLIIYANGLGPVDPPVATAAAGGAVLHTNTVTPTVLVGGVEAQVAFSGMSPQFVGVNQVNIVIPAGAPTGSAVPLQIRTGGLTSSEKVVIAVR